MGAAILAQMTAFSHNNIQKFRSKELKATYHIGLADEWRPEKSVEQAAYNEQNKKNADKLAIGWKE